ncbi:MAG: tetratricopeptide repeat protein [Deltaproteobacteria bacterium]|nr:tetratricopeptide repeat protein [Deltaproteobacteria bacterium]
MKKGWLALAALCLAASLIASCAAWDELTKDYEPDKEDSSPDEPPPIYRPKRDAKDTDEMNTGADAFDAELAGTPDKAGLLVKRGKSLIEQGDSRVAIADLTKAISNDPELVEAYYYRGVAYDSEAEYDRAIKDFSRVISLNPQYTRAYFDRASVRVKVGDTDMAIDDFGKACRMGYTPACEEREKLTGSMRGPVFNGGKIEP